MGKIFSIAKKSFFLRVISAITSYVFIIVLAKLTDEESFGFIAFSLSFCIFFAVVACVGQRLALLRYIPPMNNPAKTSELVRKAFFLVIKGSLGLVLLMGSIAYLLSNLDIISGHNAELFRLAILLIPLIAMMDMLSHLSRAFGLVWISIFSKDILWRNLTIFILFVLYTVNGNDDLAVKDILRVLMIVLLILIIHQFLYIKSKSDLNFSFSQNATTDNSLDNWRKSIAPFWISSILAVFFSNFGVVIAAFFLGLKSSGIYFVANRIALITTLVLMSYNIVISPYLSKSFSQKKVHKATLIARRAALHVMLMNSLIFIVFLLFGPDFLKLFGEDYSAAYEVGVVLILAYVIASIFGPNDILLNMSGKEKNAMKVSVIGCLFSIVIMSMGAYLGGVVALSYCTLVSLFTTKYLMWREVKSCLGINVAVLSMFKRN